MALRVRFVGGPADGALHEYDKLEQPLPSLLWEDPAAERSAVYHRRGDQPDPGTGIWSYVAVP